ncbi:MAG: BamA/TamA family outer membrane protein [Gemmatimonadota bacterium]|nr:MAG: BamA/TamA family outer membrane protein [Gemmatimonadota bacterium]
MKKSTMKFFVLSIGLLLVFMCTYLVHAADFETQTEQDTVEQKRSGLIFLPILGYTPETKMAGGAAVTFYFRAKGTEKTCRPSTLMPIFIYTQKKQIVSELNADLYWKEETIHLTSNIGYMKFPDKFYGIGNHTSEDDEEEYTPRNAYFSFNLQKKIQKVFHAGILYEFTDSKMKEVEGGRSLAQKKILGSEGGTVSGAGILMNWDTRDNIFCASSGRFYQLSTSLFRDYLGSDYDFTRYTLDLRQYIPVVTSHAIALQGYMKVITGDPPFQMMSMLGGDSLMRGYYGGRYRHKNMVVVQTEYRLPLWWRFGLVGFLGFGDVSKDIEDFVLSDFKHSAGLGLRYFLNPEEKLNIRLDLAYGKDSSGFYITLFEAF